MFLQFGNRSESSTFLNYVSGKHPNIKFRDEHEADNKYKFLDNKLIVYVCRKPTFSNQGVFFNYLSMFFCLKLIVWLKL